MIKIQSYKKQVLGSLYFPGLAAVTGRQKLLYQIAMRHELAEALRAVQPNPKAKRFSAKEVRLIVTFLGEPPFEEESEHANQSLTGSEISEQPIKSSEL